MPVARGAKDYLNLVKGLNTETNPLAFPEGYTNDELNMLLSLDGDTRLRRKGLVKKATSDVAHTNVSGENVSRPYMYYWKSADIVLSIVQEENENVYLEFLEDDATYTSIGTYLLYNGVTEIVKPSFSPILDGVIITSGEAGSTGAFTPVFIKINEAGNIEVYEVTLHFRDFELLDDGVSISQRLGTITDTRTYNLLNAGWYAERKDSTGAFVPPLSLFEIQDIVWKPTTFSANSTTNEFTLAWSYPSGGGLQAGDTFTVLNSSGNLNDGTYTVVSIVGSTPYSVVIEVASITNDETDTAGTEVTNFRGEYPSNADIPKLGLKVDETTGDEYFDPDKLFETVLGNTEAPRGHYIFDVNGTRTRDDVLADNKDDGSPSTTIELKDTIVR